MLRREVELEEFTNRTIEIQNNYKVGGMWKLGIFSCLIGVSLYSVFSHFECNEMIFFSELQESADNVDDNDDCLVLAGQ